MEITIKDLWVILKRSAILMIICAILFGAAFFAYNSFFAPKQYLSTADYILLPKGGTVEDVEELNNYLVVGGKSVTTLESVLMSENTMQQVLDYIDQRREMDPFDWDFYMDGEYTARDLLSRFAFTSSDNNTNLVFTVSCRASSAKDSRVLMEAFGDLINQQSEKVLHGVFLIELCHSPVDGRKVAPSVARNTVLGGMIGAIVPYVVIFIVSVLDTRVKKEKDLKEKFNKPVLGQIPYIG